MRMLDLFSGIGGFSLAAQWCWEDDLEIVAFCEIDKFCQKVLRKHWPDVPIWEDIKTLDGKQWTGTVDLLTGGFPCQPFSCAGKQKGKEDNRFLWPEMFRIIKEIRPSWIVAENVAGIIRMALDDCLSDLEGEGYSTQAVIIPACAINAPHRRDRVWIVAYDSQFRQLRESNQGQGRDIQEQTCSEIEQCSQDVADSRCHDARKKNQPEQSSNHASRQNWWSTEPDVGRVAHGIPDRVDRLKSLGNAIVPQVAYQIFRTIKVIEG